MWLKIALITIGLNLGIGFISYGVSSIGYTWNGIGTAYNSADAETLSQYGANVSTPNIDPNTNWWLRILDYVSLGQLTTLKNWINNYLLGFSTLIKNTGMIDDTVKAIMDAIIGIIYFIGIVNLFTGKQIENNA